MVDVQALDAARDLADERRVDLDGRRRGHDLRGLQPPRERRVRVVGARQPPRQRRVLRRFVLGREARERLLCQSVAVRVEGDRLARCGVLGVLQACRKSFVLREGVDGSCFYCVLLLGLGRDEAPAALRGGHEAGDFLLGRDLRVGGHCCGSAVCRGAK